MAGSVGAAVGGKWGLTCVGAGVPLQLVAPCEPLSAEEPVADEGPLAGVQAHMGPQQGGLPEGLAAVRDVAHMFFLALLSRPGGRDIERWEEKGKRSRRGWPRAEPGCGI